MMRTIRMTPEDKSNHRSALVGKMEEAGHTYEAHVSLWESGQKAQEFWEYDEEDALKSTIAWIWYGSRRAGWR